MNRETHHPPLAAIRKRVLDGLGRIEREHDVVMLYACESGSRAWGFVSPDNDCNVRFIYVHQPERYRCVEKPRDVIEHPLGDGLDISGWELRKALRLIHKSNPVLLEWLDSSLVYREESGVRKELLWLGNTFHPVPGSRHYYLLTTRRDYRGHLRDGNVRLKKYLYVLRSLFTVHWLDAGLGLPPVAFERLIEVAPDDPSLCKELDALPNLERRRDESVYDLPRLALQRFIEAELLQAERGVTQPTGARQSSRPLDRYLHDKIQQYTRKTS